MERRSQIAALRRHAGFSQESLAEHLQVSRSTVARWERGEVEPQPRLRVLLAGALKVSVQELERALMSAPVAVSWSGSAGEDVKQLTMGAMASLRLSDRQDGGGQLYERVLGFLSETLAPHCFGVIGSDRSDVFAAAASMTEMAGWMALEAGRPGVAEQHFVRAQDLSTIGGDAQLTAHILASRSHLAGQSAQIRRAGSLARAGLLTLAGAPSSPELQAKLMLYEARSAAVEAQRDRCHELVNEAESFLSASTFSTDSPWLSPFDEASLANEAATCMYLVGDYDEAIRQAQVVLDERPVERARSRAFAQLTMAKALVANGRRDEARSVIESLGPTVSGLQSAPVAQQHTDVAQSLGLPPSLAL